MNKKDIKNWNILGNEQNFLSPSERTAPTGTAQDKEYDSLYKLDWKKESNYHNTYYKGKGNYGIRELRMNNKKWHEINK